MKLKNSITVIGSSNTDLVLTCQDLPLKGETRMGGIFQQRPGGKGANQAVAAARAGARVIFIGARGEDPYGQTAQKILQKENIDTRHFLIKKHQNSGIALILLGGKNNDNLIGVAQSANDSLTPQDLHKRKSLIASSQVILAQLEIPLKTVEAALKIATQHQIPFVLNPAPARVLSAQILKKIYLLTPNEHEALLMTGKKSIREAGKKLVRQGCQNVVITRGSQGALWFNASQIKSFPAPRVKPLDTVGAGDCFTGWLTVGVAEKLPMELNIQRALKAASLSVTRRGAQEAMPYRTEIIDL